jgi:ribose transport system ATP-binding protein
MDRAMPMPLLHMHRVSKSFPGVQALVDVDLTLQAGEVLALLGENGAGKSTLIKILAGVHLPDAGSIDVAGVPAAIRTPLDARRAGVSVIYQELNLVLGLTALDNVFLGQETAPVLRRSDERRRARELFKHLGIDVPLDVPCGRLPAAQQQIIEIAKALVGASRILVLDEPSAALTPQEVDRLFAVVRELKSRGLGIIYISHRLDEIFAIADRVMVLRDGRHVATRPTSGVTRGELIEMMVGRKLEQEFPPRQAAVGPPRLEAKGLCRAAKVRDVSLTVHRGEIVALTGLVGSGRTEVARLLFGADRPDAGTIALDGRPLRLHSPRDAIRAGICLLTEDRKAQGLVLGRSVLENFALPNLGRWSRWGWLWRRPERHAYDRHAHSLRIRTPHAHQPVRLLSGGNQQKVVLAKWLEANCDVLIFDEPTRGIDVGAKYEIYLLMNELARQGKAILIISSELPEVLGMADRILVMHEGRITGEITNVRDATQERILEMATGWRAS